MTTPVLDVESVSKSFGAGSHRHTPVRAVDDVSFAVEAGRTLAIVGESGSGKSTTGRIALGLTRPDSGTVRILGRDIADVHGSEWRRLRRNVQPVFQDATASLNPKRRIGISVGQGVRSAAENRLPAREVAALAVEALERVGLTPGRDFLRRFPYELSGGQRQRVAVARAIAARPRLLIADEPLSGADASVRGQLLNLLERLQRDLGLAMVLITHDVSVAEALAHWTLVMTQGRVVEQGHPSQVFHDPQHAYTRQLLDAIPRITL